jgi:hypothetical protein
LLEINKMDKLISVSIISLRFKTVRYPIKDLNISRHLRSIEDQSPNGPYGFAQQYTSTKAIAGEAKDIKKANNKTTKQ